MSSHHTQSLSDPNYLLRLQNLRLNDDVATNNAIQVSHRRTSSLNGTADNEIGFSGKSQIATSNRMPTIEDDYKLYDQNKFITASKLMGPKFTSNIQTTSPKHQMNALKMPIIYRNNSSPTHSISGLSQQSVYENIEHYNPSITQQPLPPPPPPSYSHYVTSNIKSNIGCGTYEVIEKKIDTNGGTLNRFTHTPQPDDIYPSHIYENLGSVAGE